MTVFTAGLIIAGLVLGANAGAQDTARLYGRVVTVDGEVLEGFLRWDRNELSRFDVLDGLKPIPYERIREAERLDPELAERGRIDRSIVAFGVRITWDRDDVAGPPLAASAVRFVHIGSIERAGLRSARVTLDDGEVIELRTASTDFGRAMRGVVVHPGTVQARTVRWQELDRVDLRAPPPSARAVSARLYGTVVAADGLELTGAIAWDRDEVLHSDVLDGRDADGNAAIPFGEIEWIRRTDSHSARVRLRSGVERELRGTNDVNRDNRGIEVSIPAIGRAVVPWSDFRSVRFHRYSGPPWPVHRGGSLAGDVHLRDGQTVTGTIRWGNDEDRLWEMLDGWSGGSELAVELGMVRTIHRLGPDGVRVTLRDGRQLMLAGSDDVGEGHGGLFVTPGSGVLRHIRWEEVERVELAR